MLVDELGIEPGRELQELERAILVQDPSLDLPVAHPQDEPAPRGERSFVGRERELAELMAGLERARPASSSSPARWGSGRAGL